MKTITKDPKLNEFANLLLNNGFDLIVREQPEDWFHFSKYDKVGYVQLGRIEGVNFSTVHKPCRECGTGYRLTEDFAELTIENALSTFVTAPNWAKLSDIKAINKYKNAQEYVDKNTWANYQIIKHN